MLGMPVPGTPALSSTRARDPRDRDRDQRDQRRRSCQAASQRRPTFRFWSSCGGSMARTGTAIVRTTLRSHSKFSQSKYSRGSSHTKYSHSECSIVELWL